ncbi:hypothetical protein B566_EDAN010738 [Ephemera danica]|nr:hypothetical protein B566_EDAN010738 [Ephemera danica]
MYLLSVESKEENDLLVEYVEGQVYNTYMWSSTGDRLTYTNWDQNSPDHGSTPVGTEHCIEFRFVNGSWSWNDRPALHEIYFICEEICELCIKVEEKETIFADGIVNPIVVLNGTQYYFEHNLRANWYEALDFCRAHDMQLLSIETPQEEVLILNHLNTTVPGFANHWIAGTDLGVNNTWVWSSTGLRVIYENWATGQPSHMNSSNKTENAMYLGLANDQIEWYDAHEYDLRYVICEQVCLLSCQGSSAP